METLTQTLIEAFKAIRARLTAEERTRIDIASVEAVDPAVIAAPHWNFDLPAHAADKALGEDATDAMRRALVATWALELPGRAKQAALPGEVMELYPYWMDKMAAFLTAAGETDAAYDPDHWAKDVRMALVHSC